MILIRYYARIIRTDKPAHFRIILSALQIIIPRVAVVIVSSITKRVHVCDVVLAGDCAASPIQNCCGDFTVLYYKQRNLHIHSTQLCYYCHLFFCGR